MPYSPGIAYTGDRSAAQGRQNLMNAILTLVGGLTEQGRQTKELRATLSDVDPAHKDQYNKMGLGELQGHAQALELKSKQEAASLLAQEMRQRLTAGKQQASAQAAMQRALSQAQGPAMNASVLPGTDVADLFNVSVPGGPTANSLVSAMMRNPESVNTPAGQSVLGDWMRTQMAQRRGAPTFAEVGGMPVIYNQFSGQFEVDPAYKIAATERAKAALAPQPGQAPLKTPDGKFFWSGKEWKPVPQTKSSSLVDEGPVTSTAAPTAAQPQFKAGDKVRQGGKVYRYTGSEWVEDQ